MHIRILGIYMSTYLNFEGRVFKYLKFFAARISILSIFRRTYIGMYLNFETKTCIGYGSSATS